MASKFLQVITGLDFIIIDLTGDKIKSFLTCVCVCDLQRSTISVCKQMICMNFKVAILLWTYQYLNYEIMKQCLCLS